MAEVAEAVAGLAALRTGAASAGVDLTGLPPEQAAWLGGLDLDPAQQSTLRIGTARAADGRWAAFKVAVVDVARQGSVWTDAILDFRALAGLFLFNERLIVHCARDGQSSHAAFRRVQALVEGRDFLRGEVRRCVATNGNQRIELLSGAQLRFIVPGRGAGKAFSADCLIWDDAPAGRRLEEMLPSLAGRPNSQMWYASPYVPDLDTSA